MTTPITMKKSHREVKETSNGMQVPVVNQKNEKVGTMELPPTIFGVKWNPRLVQQVVTSQLANRRKPIAHTKTRGEVRGGGRKPWAQKHTGRARHGSSRSPLWSGGGVTFGPRKDRDFTKRIPLAMKRSALRTVLSKKLTDDEVKVVDSFALAAPKTKHVAVFLKALCGGDRVNALLVPAKGTVDLFRAGRNIPHAKALRAPSLNVYDCLAYRYVIFEKGAVAELGASAK